MCSFCSLLDMAVFSCGPLRPSTPFNARYAAHTYTTHTHTQHTTTMHTYTHCTYTHALANTLHTHCTHATLHTYTSHTYTLRTHTKCTHTHCERKSLLLYSGAVQLVIIVLIQYDTTRVGEERAMLTRQVGLHCFLRGTLLPSKLSTRLRPPQQLVVRLLGEQGKAGIVRQTAKTLRLHDYHSCVRACVCVRERERRK